MSSRIFAALAVFLLAALPLSSAEPAGSFHLDWDWIEGPGGAPLESVAGATVRSRSPSGGAAGWLRVRATSPSDLTESSLVLLAPSGIELSPPSDAGFVRTSLAAGVRWERELGAWPAGETRVFEMLVTSPPVGGGVLEIRASGVSSSVVVPWLDAVGVSVGHVGATPRVRDGVSEYPAGRPRAGER